MRRQFRRMAFRHCGSRSVWAGPAWRMFLQEAPLILIKMPEVKSATLRPPRDGVQMHARRIWGVASLDQAAPISWHEWR